MFPKLRKRIPQGSGSTDSVSDKEEDEATDYVFRILFPNSQSEFGETPCRQSNENMSSGHSLYLLSLFVAVTLTHPPSLTFSLSHQPSVPPPSKTALLVVPRRPCICLDGSSSITGSSCNTDTSSPALSACLALIRHLLISS